MFKYFLLPLALLFQELQAPPPAWQLQHLADADALLYARAEQIFVEMSEQERVAQMLVVAVGRYGKPKKKVAELIKNYKIGGVLLLHGGKEEFIEYVQEFDILTRSLGALPLLYSADAEPSLIHNKIKGVRRFKNTSEIEDEEESEQIALQICSELAEIGIKHNYAPVCDLSNSNVAIGKRSFGDELARVLAFSQAFMAASHRNNILATAKHFPGHGFVHGDTHKQLVYIDGELNEVEVYKKLIDTGFAMSIMVGHIAVQNNAQYDTQGLPATISPVIVSKLLKEELGFDGLIVTDAMNMGAVRNIPHAPFLAAKAGCDLILMPENEAEFLEDVLREMEQNEAFREQIYASIKKIIRFKVALGLI